MKKNHRIKRKILLVFIILILITSSLLTSCQNSEIDATTVTSVQSQALETVSLVETDYDSDNFQTDFNTDEIQVGKFLIIK